MLRMRTSVHAAPDAVSAPNRPPATSESRQTESVTSRCVASLSASRDSAIRVPRRSSPSIRQRSMRQPANDAPVADWSREVAVDEVDRLVVAARLQAAPGGTA